MYRSKECSQFNISLLEAESLDDLQRDINDVEKVWVLYEDFHSQLDEMKSQDWISFRSVFFADYVETKDEFKVAKLNVESYIECLFMTEESVMNLTTCCKHGMQS